MVIDASLDPQVYLDLSSQYGWQITSVLDTHIHADHLSRSHQLAERSGAMLFLPDQQRVSFPFTAMRDGDTLATPRLTRRYISTWRGAMGGRSPASSTHTFMPTISRARASSRR